MVGVAPIRSATAPPSRLAATAASPNSHNRRASPPPVRPDAAVITGPRKVITTNWPAKNISVTESARAAPGSRSNPPSCRRVDAGAARSAGRRQRSTTSAASAARATAANTARQPTPVASSEPRGMPSTWATVMPANTSASARARRSGAAMATATEAAIGV